MYELTELPYQPWLAIDDIYDELDLDLVLRMLAEVDDELTDRDIERCLNGERVA